jgi:hypothetical protein
VAVVLSKEATAAPSKNLQREKILYPDRVWCMEFIAVVGVKAMFVLVVC